MLEISATTIISFDILIGIEVMGTTVIAFTVEENAKFHLEVDQNRVVIFFLVSG